LDKQAPFLKISLNYVEKVVETLKIIQNIHIIESSRKVGGAYLKFFAACLKSEMAAA
jgi:hypothetical protein